MKKVVCLFTLVFFLLAFAACSSSNNNSISAEITTTAATIVPAETTTSTTIIETTKPAETTHVCSYKMNIGVREPTCTVPGCTYYEYACCGRYISIKERLPATGHFYKDGACIHCGEKSKINGFIER